MRQRLHPADYPAMRRLRHQVDPDRVTEVWRVRAFRRRRLAIVAAVAWLVSILILQVVQEAAGWFGLVVAAACAVGGAAVAGRNVYARARRWGNYREL